MGFFDWKKALLNYYRNLDLNETEVTIIYLIDYINSEYEGIVTPDLLALKSTLDYSEIDDVFNNLITKNYVNIICKNDKMITSLDTIKEMLFELYLLDVNTNKKETEENKQLINELKEIFEANFNRELSFIEIDTIKEWIHEGYRKDNILFALKEAISHKIKAVNYIGKLLLKWKKQEERTSEGYTTITDTWHKDISESNKLTDLNWTNKDEE